MLALFFPRSHSHPYKGNFLPFRILSRQFDYRDLTKLSSDVDAL